MKKLFDIVGYYQKADPALAITLKFVLAGILWILFSDSFLFLIGSENIIWQLAHVHILKGLLFVGITGGFIFYWINTYVNSLQHREAEVKELFLSSPVAMAIVDAGTFQISEANESLAMLYGFPKEHFAKYNLADLAVEKEKFETVPLLIKTGRRDLGIWQQRKSDGSVISVKLGAQPVRDRKAFLVLFIDVTRHVENEAEQRSRHQDVEEKMQEQIVHLTRLNEELAYRASQTEHVNAELISVNEQLQLVNKKIALRAEDFKASNERLNEIMTTLSDVFFSFDLTGKTKSYVSSTAQALFEENMEALSKPWFWLDYVHPDDSAIKEASQQELLDTEQACCAYRIVTAKGNTRIVFSRIRLVHNEKGITMLHGSVSDISSLVDDVEKINSLKPKMKQV